MDAFDWKYAGEGGKHAVFAYYPGGKVQNEFCGRMLRIQKKDLAIAASFSGHSGHSFHAESHRSDEMEDQVSFIAKVISPCLEYYVDVPSVLPLWWTFLQHLRDLTLSSGKVPLAREKGWNFSSSNRSFDFSICPLGLLVVDYRKISTPGWITYETNLLGSVSIEIKPKAGYRAFSPLVDPLHRIKYLESRFALLQRLHSEGYVTKGWRTDSDSFESSSYDPEFFFSNDPTKIQNALASLFSCPQNNLRVWFEDSMVIGLGCEERTDKRKVLSKFFRRDDVDSADAESVFGSIVGGMVSAILHEETLLARLQKLQKLDILDADGAILLYEHLVRLCDGSFETAERLLDHIDDNETTNELVHELLAASPLPVPSQITHINELCREIESFRRLLVQYSPTLPPLIEINFARDRAMKLLDLLTPEESRFVLRNWLLSLASCDVSIFITLRLLDTHLNNDSKSEKGGKITSKIDCGKPGIIRWYPGGKFVARYIYNVKVIDCGRKAARKLRSRRDVESAFRFIQPQGAFFAS